MKVGKLTDRGRWDEFVERHDGPVFDSWGWGQLCEACGHHTYRLAVEDRGELLACLPLVHMESLLFGDKLVSMPYSAYGSVVSEDEAPEEAIDLLLESVRDLADSLEVDFVSLRGRELGDPPGFEKENRFVTFSIPLTVDRDDIWENVKESRQRQITQASESSLQYRVGDSVEDLREYYRLYLATMRGHGTPPHSFRFFRILWNRFFERGDLRLGLVEKNGKLVNGILDLASGSTVYQWGVISDYDHRDLNGGSLALWKSLERSYEDGYDTYEMGRTREGSGVYMFKKSWGGEKVWFDDYHYFPGGKAELPNPDDEKYDRVKDVWKRLPLKATELIGPPIRRNIDL